MDKIGKEFNESPYPWLSERHRFAPPRAGRSRFGFRTREERPTRGQSRRAGRSDFSGDDPEGSTPHRVVRQELLEAVAHAHVGAPVFVEIGALGAFKVNVTV